MALCPVVCGGPTHLASGEVTDKQNSGGGSSGGSSSYRARGGKAEGVWGTQGHLPSLLVTSKRNRDGAGRDTVLITSLCFCSGGVCLHVHTHTHTLFFGVCVCRKDREHCVYTWIYSFIKTTSQLESTIGFFCFSVECWNIKHYFSFWSYYTEIVSQPVEQIHIIKCRARIHCGLFLNSSNQMQNIKFHPHCSAHRLNYTDQHFLLYICGSHWGQLRWLWEK